MFLYFPLHSIECHMAHSFLKKVFDLYIGVLTVDGTVESPSRSFFFFFSDTPSNFDAGITLGGTDLGKGWKSLMSALIHSRVHTFSDMHASIS